MEEKKKRKAGRPSLKESIDIEILTKLSMILCTPQEMGYIMNVDYRTLTKHYGHVIEKGRANGKMALRRKQFEVAMSSNNAAMLIWLGKNWLNQQENPISEADAKALPWNDDIID
jgi:hypothetical protein|tara:strand:+ start:3106 stop:3450 length:345 start_codon:yes stop_codon:yes gene_type:complete